MTQSAAHSTSKPAPLSHHSSGIVVEPLKELLHVLFVSGSITSNSIFP